MVTPLFLFSGTFFPVTQLPPVLRWIAYVTPLWHGVALCRGLALGTIGALAGPRPRRRARAPSPASAWRWPSATTDRKLTP